MKKLLVIPSKKNIDNLIDSADAFLLSLKDYSTNSNIYFTIEEIKENIKKIKNKNKEVFISINKNIHSTKLDDFKSILKELSLLEIDGIFYYDQAIYELNKEFNMNLIYYNEHSNTNYKTIDFLNSIGINGFYLSSEITLEEIKQIRSNTKSILVLPIFGYIPMFTSERPLITNYTKTYDLENNSNIHYLNKEGKTYPITEDEITTTYTSSILNGLDEFKELDDIEYFSLNEFEIEEEKFIEILNIFKNNENKKIEDIIDNTSKGFLHTRTVYKVK